ncbi:PAS domain S-box protein [bacterium]|nr:PAS domain S-box protein [bacterium]
MTERDHLSEDRLREEIEGWAIKRAFSHLRLGFALVNNQMRIKYCNPLFARMTGKKNPDEVLEMLISKAVPELKNFDYWIQRTVERRLPQGRMIADLRVVRSEQGKDEFYSLIVDTLPEFGDSFLVIISEIQPDILLDVHSREALKNVYDQQKNLRRLHVQMNEVVQLREQSLRAARAINDAVLRSTSDGVLVIRSNGEIVQGNMSAELILAENAGEIIGKSLWGYLDREHTQPKILRGIEEGDYASFMESIELRLLSESGVSFYIEATINPLLMEDEDLFVAVLRDVTERVKKENEIHRHRAALRTLAARLVETQEEERRRIALDLHDDIGQRITGLGMEIRQVFGSLGFDLADIAPELVRQVEETAGAVRSLSRDLRPSVLDHFGLVDALDVLGTRFKERSNLQIAFKFERIKSGDRLVSEVESSAYRIIQEALNNVVKYADVDRAMVFVALREDLLVVSIRDEGSGFDFDPHGISKKSIGILGMKERALQLGGDLFVISAPNLGTTIMAELPLTSRS